MAWWTNTLFSEVTPNKGEETNSKEESIFTVFYRAIHEYVHEHFIDILYKVLSITTYLYITASIIVFFFQHSIPKILPYMIEALSEPYLGTLGVYVVIKEMERRRGRVIQRKWGELFAIIWFGFFIVASFFTFSYDNYPVGTLYKSIVTNALAAVIIRIGTLIR